MFDILFLQVTTDNIKIITNLSTLGGILFGVFKVGKWVEEVKKDNEATRITIIELKAYGSTITKQTQEIALIDRDLATVKSELNKVRRRVHKLNNSIHDIVEGIVKFHVDNLNDKLDDMIRRQSNLESTVQEYMQDGRNPKRNAST